MRNRAVGIVALLVPCIAGVPAWADTLEDALVAAYQSNPTLLAARAQLRQQDEGVAQAESNWRPTVSVTGDAGRDYVTSNLLFPPNQSLTARDDTLNITQPLYRGGQTTAQVAEAEAQVKSGRAQLDATEETVFLGVAQTYLDVLLAQAIVDLQRQNERVLQHQLDTTRAQVGVGSVTAIDVAQAQAAVEGAHGALVQAQGNLQVAIASYAAVVGRPPHLLTSPGTAARLPGTVEALTTTTLDGNPTVVAQRYAVEAAEHGVELAAGELLPQLSLQASGGRVLNESDHNSDVINREILLNLTVPIYQQGAEYSRLRQQKQVVGQQRQLLDQAQRSAINQATAAWESLASAQAQIASYRAQIVAAETALAGRQKQFGVGASSELDILQAQQTVLSAHIAQEQARHDAALASYQIESAIGQLTARTLRLPVTIYDPIQHYEDVRNRWIGTEGDTDAK